MVTYQVTCITTSGGLLGRTHEHITHIGNKTAEWRLTKEEAISMIDSKTAEFYVVDPHNSSKRSTVGVVRPTFGNPYLRTHADGYYNDNLLSLGDC